MSEALDTVRQRITGPTLLILSTLVLICLLIGLPADGSTIGNWLTLSRRFVTQTSVSRNYGVGPSFVAFDTPDGVRVFGLNDSAEEIIELVARGHTQYDGWIELRPHARGLLAPTQHGVLHESGWYRVNGTPVANEKSAEMTKQAVRLCDEVGYKRQWLHLLQQRDGWTSTGIRWIGVAHNLSILGAMAGVAIGVVTTHLWVRRMNENYRKAQIERGECPACGYDIGGLPDGVCPECGHKFGVALPQSRQDHGTQNTQ